MNEAPRTVGRSPSRIMFGTKLRTWMEAHIVRSKKKKDRKGKGEKGFDSNSNSPRNGSHRSAALHQVSMFRRRPYETLFWCSFAATVLLYSLKGENESRGANERRDERRATASHSLFLSPSASVDSLSSSSQLLSNLDRIPVVHDSRLFRFTRSLPAHNFLPYEPFARFSAPPRFRKNRENGCRL